MDKIYDKKRNLLFEGEIKDLSYLDLRGANLNYANLKGANLSYADLSYYTDLSYANLRGANLSYADLSYANLKVANLRGANLRGANLKSADLSYADLRDTDLRGAKYSYINILKIFIYTNNEDLILDLMLWDSESCGIEKMDTWIKTEVCPFKNSERDFYFDENEKVWENKKRNEKKYKTLKELFIAIAKDLNIKI